MFKSDALQIIIVIYSNGSLDDASNRYGTSTLPISIRSFVVSRYALTFGKLTDCTAVTIIILHQSNPRSGAFQLILHRMAFVDISY